MVFIGRAESKLNTTNRILTVLLKIWKRCVPQLIPSLSPLASMVWHPWFHMLMQLDDQKLEVGGIGQIG